MYPRRHVIIKHFNYQMIMVVLITLLMGSCVTTKKTRYLQEYETEGFPAVDSADLSYRLQPSDNLFIRVVTPDPTRAAMFNTLPVTASTMSVGPQAVDLLSYSVQEDGTVDIPYLGKVEVAGMTLPEVKKVLEEVLDDYIMDAAITVKLVNNYVSIIGEVNRPGRYPIYKENMNIFQALAMAGDMDDYSNRYKVQVIRQQPGGTLVKDFDLTNKSIIDSEYFYILPNDVIYAEPMKGKIFQMATFPFALIISTISTGILLYRVIE